MQMFFDIIINNSAYIIIGMSVVIFLMFIFCITISLRLSKLKKRYEKFTGGSETHPESMEVILDTYNENITKVAEKYGKVLDRIGELDEEIKYCTQKVGVVRYNPFEEMGGNLCYAVALLDSRDNGVVLNGIHGRNGTFSYAKPIERGVSTYVLTGEELEALEKAKEGAYKPNTVKRNVELDKEIDLKEPEIKEELNIQEIENVEEKAEEEKIEELNETLDDM